MKDPDTEYSNTPMRDRIVTELKNCEGVLSAIALLARCKVRGGDDRFDFVQELEKLVDEKAVVRLRISGTDSNPRWGYRLGVVEIPALPHVTTPPTPKALKRRVEETTATLARITSRTVERAREIAGLTAPAKSAAKPRRARRTFSQICDAVQAALADGPLNRGGLMARAQINSNHVYDSATTYLRSCNVIERESDNFGALWRLVTENRGESREEVQRDRMGQSGEDSAKALARLADGVVVSTPLLQARTITASKPDASPRFAMWDDGRLQISATLEGPSVTIGADDVARLRRFLAQCMGERL